LLRLDESIKAKTVSKAVLDTLPAHIIAARAEDPDICTICMCDLEAGDQATTLPCAHVFHRACITTWLSSCADRCPVDSLPFS